MSARPLARRHRRQRDARKFVIATEDTFAPKQYFDAFELNRVSVEVVPTMDNRSAATHVVNRLKELRERARQLGDLVDGDEFWVLLDTDHWTRGTHVAQFARAIKEGRDAGFSVAVSNPCFELWLLLHVVEEPPNPCTAETLTNALRAACGSFNKTNIPVERIMPGVEEALRRARQLDLGENGWPQAVGTQVCRLVELLLRG